MSSKAALDWAAKRRAAMERAKQLREERKRGGDLTQEHTFKPKTNPRRAAPSKTLTDGGYPVFDDSTAYAAPNKDTLDDVTSKYTSRSNAHHASRRHEEDMADRIAADNQQVPSPGADSLTYEARKHGHQAIGYSDAAAAPDTDEAFFSSLRGGDAPQSNRRKQKKKRPEWNNDFVAPAAPLDAEPTGQPAQQKAQYYNDMRSELKQAREFDPSNYSDHQPPAAAAPAPGGYAAQAAARRAARGGSAGRSRAPPGASGASVGSAKRRGGGRMFSAEELAGGPPAASAAAAPPQQQQYANDPYGNDPYGNDPYGNDPYGAPPAAPVARQRRPGAGSAGSRRSTGSVTKEELQHEVAAPKLALLKSRIKSKRSFRRTNSGRSVGSVRAASATPPASESTTAPAPARFQQRSATSHDKYSEDENAQPWMQQQQAPRQQAAPARAARASAGRRRAQAAQQQQQQQQQYQQQGYGNGYNEQPPAVAPPAAGGGFAARSGAGRPPRAAAARVAPAAAAAGGGGACTRDSTCTCSACAAANAVLTDPYAAVEAPVVDEPRYACSSCGRKFSEKALSIHERNCRKVFQSKRKAFDSKAARVEGTEAAQFAKEQGGRRRGGRGGRAPRGSAAGAGAGAAAMAKKAAWKAKSSAFRDAMKAARQYKEAKAAGREPPPMVAASAPDPSLVPCPHCGRRFNDKAAERHIPHCKNTKARPKRLIRGSGHSAVARATGKKTTTTGAASRRMGGRR